MELNLKELKKGGIIKQVQNDYFAVRLRVAGGNLALDQVAALHRVAEKYGRGYLHLTTRQGVEIPFIHFRDIENVRSELAAGGLSLGVCGGTVRGVMACQGSAVCSHGLIDGRELSSAIDRRFFGAAAPGKFKIAVTGCTRSCAKPQVNDLGFEGVVNPVLERETCLGCGVCADGCPAGAISMAEDIPVLDTDKCTHCGDCLSSCPVAAWQAQEVGVRVWAGGRIGRHPALGRAVLDFLPLEKIPAIIEASLDFYRRHGRTKERFGRVLERVGFEKYREAVRHATNP